jgi:hypothetical protein
MPEAQFPGTLLLGSSVNSNVSPDENQSLLLDNTVRNCRKSGRC